MNIIKPQKILVSNLTKTKNLLEEIKDDEIANYYVEKNIEENIDIYDISIKNTIMDDVEILNGKLEKNSFTDVRFNNCNFSNTSFENCSFIRCEFDNCKLTGCNFSGSRMYNVSFKEVNMNYINRSTKRAMETCNIEFIKSDLTQAQFFHTKLKDIDLSDSIIEGIAVSIDDIKGAIINQFQATDLLYLLGVKLKE